MGNMIQWIDYMGKRIMVADFSNFNEQQYLDGTDAMEKALLELPRNSKPLLIVNVTDSHMTQKTSDRGKETVAKLSQAGIVAPTAMVGISGIKKIIAQAISRDVYFAKSMDDAKEWLVKQA